MGLDLHPVAKMARRIFTKHSLQIPFDIIALVRSYAKITYLDIPVEGVDGICLHLKTVGKTPKIILNRNSSQTRTNFTIAHELGHIIIPWHYGTIIDEIKESYGMRDTIYWEIEREANLFASELLMPFDWIFSLYQKNPNVEYIIRNICNSCKVSEWAAKIRLERAIKEIEYILLPIDIILNIYNQTKDLALTHSQLVNITNFAPKRVAELIVRDFPNKVAYCIESGNKVIGSGGSERSHPVYQSEGQNFIKSPYKYFQSYCTSDIEGIRTHWWLFDENLNIATDYRNWREILDSIAKDISFGKERSFKASINGKISGAHGMWLQKKKGNLIEFIHDVIRRFDDPHFHDFLEHSDFLVFIKKRCEALYVNKYLYLIT